ncbi:MAG: hypothetical protein IJF78_10285 [Clostridia bacterium]|nr:hypothetical protein [Clostridia bacterium]
MRGNLRFSDDQKPPSKLAHGIQDIPVNLAVGTVHREIHESEQDNVGVEAAHKIEASAEIGGHLTQNAHRSHSQNKRTERTDPYASNPQSKSQQKRAIRQEYAAAKHSQSTAETARTTTKTAKRAAGGQKNVRRFVTNNKHILLIFGGILVMLLFLMSAVSSCSMLFQGGISAFSSSVYTGEDVDMQSAETLYLVMEEELQEYLDNYESEYEFESYIFDLDEIGHNPYELTALITALHGGSWTADEIGDILAEIFEAQYILTEEIHGDTVIITLESTSIGELAEVLLTEEQLEMYEVYFTVLEDRTDLFETE